MGKKKKKSSGPAPPKETARASHTSRGLAIFKHTFGLRALLRAPQQRLLEPPSNPAKDIVPARRASKEQHGPTAYVYTQAGPRAMEGLDYFPAVASLSCDHSAVVWGTGCEVLRLVTE